MRERYYILILVVLMISCTSKDKNDYQKVSLIEMTIDSLSRIFPDDFLYTGNGQAVTINITSKKNFEIEYKNIYTYDLVYGVITSMRLYSDGDYYVTEYSYDKSKLIAEIFYIDYSEKKILRSYIYKYTNGKETAIDVLDADNKIVRSYMINSKINDTIIQKFNNTNELESEYIYQYENDRLISVTTTAPRVKTILKREIYYLENKIVRTELYSEPEHNLVSKKEYQYDNDGKLIVLIQTNQIYDGSVEIHKEVFKEHDANGNWTICEGYKDIVYKRDIIYRVMLE